jgi:hypothetical protein
MPIGGRTTMSEYEEVFGKHFRDQAVPADGRAFVDCSFDETILVFSGTSPFIVSGGTGCPKVACVEHAATTLMQLATLYESGFAGVVEDLFRKIRDPFGDRAARNESQISLPLA